MNDQLSKIQARKLKSFQTSTTVQPMKNELGPTDIFQRMQTWQQLNYLELKKKN